MPAWQSGGMECRSEEMVSVHGPPIKGMRPKKWMRLPEEKAWSHFGGLSRAGIGFWLTSFRNWKNNERS